LLALAAAGPALAGTPTCSVTTGAVAFGAYDATAPGHTDSSGYVDVQCTCTPLNDCTDLPYTLEIQAGASASLAPRRMERSGGTETLDYNLYQDSNHAVLWSTGPNALGRTYGAAVFETPQRSTVYGRIPAGQHVRPGSYGETPAVTMIY
jgi:spore coat protein U-like protein